MIVQIQRRTNLLDQAILHHDYLVSHGHRLDLVMGDVYHRGLQPVVQIYYLGTHLYTELGIEV